MTLRLAVAVPLLAFLLAACLPAEYRRELDASQAELRSARMSLEEARTIGSGDLQTAIDRLATAEKRAQDIAAMALSERVASGAGIGAAVTDAAGKLFGGHPLLGFVLPLLSAGLGGVRDGLRRKEGK